MSFSYLSMKPKIEGNEEKDRRDVEEREQEGIWDDLQSDKGDTEMKKRDQAKRQY